MRRSLILSPWFLPACLLAGLLLRVAWILAVDAAPVDDFSWYHDRGVDLAAGRGLQDHGKLTAYWPVGYPALLGALYAVLGPSPRVAQAANVVMAMAILIMTWHLGRRVLRSETGARAAVGLMAVWPNQIAYVSLTATEIPFLFLLMLAVLMWLRPRAGLVWAIGTGLLFGLATLIRPQAALLPAFMGVTWWLASGRPRPTWKMMAAPACLHLALALTLVPWTVRNHRVFGAFVFVANSGGINLLIGNNPRATGGYMEVPEILAEPGELQRDRLASRLAKEYIFAHPMRTIARWPAKIWHLYSKDVEGLYWNEMAMGRGDGAPSQRPLWMLKLAAQGFWLALLAGAVWALVSSMRRGPGLLDNPAGLAAGWGVVAYFTLIFMALFGSTRFHFPLAPFLALPAGAWLAARFQPQPVPAVARPQMAGVVGRSIP
jgi:4-amino-4-deoxy-L-arabinose transferase-like glycosyltransferase